MSAAAPGKVKKPVSPEEVSSTGVRMAEARRVLEGISQELIFRSLPLAEVKRISGFDVAYEGTRAVIAGVAFDCAERAVVEVKTLHANVWVPYIPGLLSFREGPLVLAVHERLECDSDVLMVEGHGVAHPLGCGLASYVGYMARKPTVGVAKKILHGSVGSRRGNLASVKDGDKQIGAALYRPSRSSPIYVSVGNLLTLESAVAIVESCWLQGRMPEPLRLAHRFAAEELRKHRRFCAD